MPLKSIKESAAAIKKAYGEETGGLGFEFPKLTRLTTGILQLDVGLAGGIPLGCQSLFYGAASSGKTSLALRTVARYQKAYPEKAVVWLDAENSWDEDWVKLHGIDPKKVYLYIPSTAEQAADIVKEVGMAEETGLVVIDSINALASIEQLEKSAQQAIVGGASKPVTALFRNLQLSMSEHAKAKIPLTVICINQPRDKIGVMFGNPEFVPGPKVQDFQAFLKLRLTGKPELEEKVAPVPIYMTNSAKVMKKKFPCVRQSAEWQTILYPHKKGEKLLKPLDVNNEHYFGRMLTNQQWLEKDGKDWIFSLTGEVFPTKTALIDACMSPENYDQTIATIVEELLLLYKDEVEQFLAGKAEMSG